MNHKLATLTVVTAALMQGALAMDYYVSLDGNDQWSGTRASPKRDKTDGPFRTLERARDEVRRLKAAGPVRDVTILLRGGVYSLGQTFLLEAQDSGTPEAPVVYRAYRREKVVLAGGPTVPADAFRPVTDPKVLERLDPAARGQVLQADLRALGIADLGKYPVKYQGAPAAPELFFNDRRMAVARWPD